VAGLVSALALALALVRVPVPVLALELVLVLELALALDLPCLVHMEGLIEPLGPHTRTVRCTRCLPTPPRMPVASLVAWLSPRCPLQSWC